MLAGALTFTIGGALILRLGVADPPYAGNRSTFLPLIELQNKAEAVLKLPAPPFTVEASAIFPAHAVWQFVLADSKQTALQFELYDDGTYTIRRPVEVLRAGFPHLRGAGERMRVRIDVTTTGETVLRFNNEIAWRGTLELGQVWECQARFNVPPQRPINPAWEFLRVYFPGSN
jgi:hypothetical protein